MNTIKLIFQGVSEIVGSEDVGLIILTDEAEKHQISISCDRNILYQFGLRMRYKKQLNGLLPETLWSIISANHDKSRFEIIINDLINGQFRALFCNLDTLEQVSMRACDAVLLHYISKIPICIETGLMQAQYIDYHEKSHSIPLPINAISNEILKDALNKAIETENYELASNLRDEIHRRETNTNV